MPIYICDCGTAMFTSIKLTQAQAHSLVHPHSRSLSCSPAHTLTPCLALTLTPCLALTLTHTLTESSTLVPNKTGHLNAVSWRVMSDE